MLVALLQDERYQRAVDVALRTLLWIVLITGVVVTMFPFLWSALLSTHDRSTMFATEITLHFGGNLGNNYQRLLEIMPFWTAMFNSFKVAFLGTLFSLLFCSMCGYALAVYRFRGRNLVFTVMVCSLMIPPVLTLIPYYLIVDALGLVDTHLAVWLPFTINPIGIFLMRQYTVASIPRELLEAARLDGAGEFRIYWSIVLPLLKPALATLAIVQFVFLWNNFLNPLVVLTSAETQVITQALRSVQNVPNTPWGAVMLGTTISILPLIVVYLFSSRQMISGLTAGAVKQ